MQNNHWFNNACIAISKEQLAIMEQRSGEYGDTWANCQWLCTKQVVAEMLSWDTIPDAALPVFYKAIGLAAFVDMKYARSEGPYKEDTLLDMGNYIAGLVVARRELQKIKMCLRLASADFDKHVDASKI